MKNNVLKKQTDLIYKIIEKVWLITICIIVYFEICNFIEILKEGRSLDLSNNGLKEFLILNDGILQIPVFSSAITTLLLAWITVKIYLDTYFTTHESNLNNQSVNQYATYLKHYENFIMMLEIKSKNLQYLSPNSINTLDFYNYIFPNVKDGNLEVSNQYIDIITKINDSIIKQNNNLPKKIQYIDHITLLINEAEKMGITLPLYERKNFLKIEHDLHTFLNHVNSNLNTSKLEKLKYSIY